MAPLLLLAAILLTTGVQSLVLVSGGHLRISELVAVQNEVVLYRDRAGVLFSIRLEEVDLTLTTDPEQTDGDELRADIAVISPGAELSIPSREMAEEERARILSDFYASVREGSPPVFEDFSGDTVAEDDSEEESSNDESYWRNESLARKDAVRRRKEDVDRARERAEVLNDQLLFLAGSTGDASSYAYLVEELNRIRSQIPKLEQALLASELEQRKFEDQARRRGILPGWLR